MWDNIVGRHIRRVNRNLLVWNLIVLAIIVVALLAERRYFYNVFAGPFPITHKDLAKIGDPEAVDHYYVTVGQVTVEDTGLQAVERTRNKYTGEITSQKTTGSGTVDWVVAEANTYQQPCRVRAEELDVLGAEGDRVRAVRQAAAGHVNLKS